MPAAPVISVVVPVHDVRDYLADCLASLQAQDVDGLEVLCIDDGSTDGSGELLEDLAAGDPRIRVWHQANAGLGATRTRGAELATGTFLAFLDSDDLLPAGAYAHLLDAIRSSGSDLVTGDIRRLTSVGLRPSPTFSPLYHPARSGTHVTRDHALLQDRIAPNKLYRRAFWQQHGLAFPSGVLYEDTPVTLRAHVLARSVDVLDVCVYIWRIRQGADRSITQQRLAPRALRDRIAAVTDVSRFLADQGHTELRRVYDGLALTDDLRLFARELDRADADYVATFLADGGRFLAAADPGALADAPAVERVRWELVRRGDAAGLVALARALHVAPPDLPVRAGRGGRVELELPGELAQGRFDRDLVRLGPELVLQTAVEAVTVLDGRLVVDGWAAIAHVAVPDARDRRLRLWLEHTGSGARREVTDVVPRPAPAASGAGRGAGVDRTGAGFRATIDATALAGDWERGTDRWRLHVEVAVGRLVRTGPVTGIAPGPARRPPAVDVGRLRVGPRVDHDALDVVVAARPVLVTAVRAVPAGIELRLTSRRALQHVRLRVVGHPDRTVPLVQLDDGGALGVVLDPAMLAAPPDPAASDPAPADVGPGPAVRTAQLHAVDDRGRVARLAVTDDVDQAAVAVPGGAVVLEISRYGYASLALRPPTLWLEAAVATTRGCELRGRLLGADVASLSLGRMPRDRHDPRPVPVRPAAAGSGDGDRVVVDLAGAEVGDVAGSWELAASLRPPPAAPPAAAPPAASTAVVPVTLLLARSLVASLPLDLPGGRLPVCLDDRSWQRPELVVADGLAADERGPVHAAARAQEARAAAGGGRRRRLDGGVLVLARGGRSTHGCPRAVVDQLRRADPSLPVRWAVAGADVDPPDGDDAVVVGSRGFHAALARARIVLSDGPLPSAFVRHPGQHVVRLWDGTPVRPVGRRGPGVRGAEQPADAARAWSSVVAAGPQAAALLADGFDLAAPTLALGLPRHDVLADPAATAALRQAARRALGLAPDTPVVLHLPTWSDAARHPGGRLRRLSDLDLPALQQALVARLGSRPDRPDPVVLVRAHPEVVDTFAELDPLPGLVDVRGDLDGIALLLAADVVLAHPSSVVLEATRAGRPVVLHDPAGFDLATELGPPHLDVAATAHPVAVSRDLATAVDALDTALRTVSDGAGGGHTRSDAAEVDPSRHLETVDGRAATTVVASVLGGPPPRP